MRTSFLLSAALAVGGIGLAGCQNDNPKDDRGTTTMTGGGGTDTYRNNPNDRYRDSGNIGTGVGTGAGTAGSVNGGTGTGGTGAGSTGTGATGTGGTTGGASGGR